MWIAQITAAAKVTKSPRLNPDNSDLKVSKIRPIATIIIERVCCLLNFSQPNKNKIIGKQKNTINFQRLKMLKMYRYYFYISKLTLQDKQLEVTIHKSSLQTSFQRIYKSTIALK